MLEVACPKIRPYIGSDNDEEEVIDIGLVSNYQPLSTPSPWYKPGATLVEGQKQSGLANNLREEIHI